MMAGAKEVYRKDNKKLYELVDNLAITAGLSTPKIYVIHDQAMNAFATGRDPRHAVIAFTSGLLDNLSKVEIEGVAAHEMSHIKNFDTRLSTVVIIFVGLIGIMAEWFIRLGWLGGRSKSKSDSGNGIFAIFGLILIILSPVIAQIIQLALSRNREYLADADAALLTRFPEGLIGALEKLSNQNKLLRGQSNMMNHMYITDPVKSLAGSKSNWLGNLFSTHPPIEERIKRLKNMN
jgi:heat shock protein HtpX